MKWYLKLASGIKNHIPEILSAFGAAGVVGTAIVSSKAGSNLAACETTNQKIKNYIPTAIVAGGTIACIVGSTMLSKKVQASLIAAYAALEAEYNKFRAGTNDAFGRNADEYVDHVISESERVPCPNEVVYHFSFAWDPDTQFDATYAEVLNAEINLNRELAYNGEARELQLRNYISIEIERELPETDYSHRSKYCGWTVDRLAEDYECYYIDFNHRFDGGSCVIDNFIGPEYIPEFEEEDK